MTHRKVVVDNVLLSPKDHLILLGRIYVEQRLAWLNRKAQAAADERDRHQPQESECAR